MYEYGHYILNSGWGGIGIYDASMTLRTEYRTNSSTDPKTIPASQIHKYADNEIRAIPVIPDEAVIAGTGGGYEEVLFNDDMCDKIVNMLNKQMETK